MSKDVLVTWAWEIDVATDEGEVGPAGRWAECIVDLAAEVRAEREKVAQLETSLSGARISNDALRERAFEAEARVTELERKLAQEHQRAEDWKYLSGGNCALLEEMTVERDALLARVAELEPDAVLGKMVNEMPPCSDLFHVRSTAGNDFFMYSELRPAWGTYSRCQRDAKSAFEAMRAVKEKQ